jgi:hypothetical protein
MLQQTAFEPVFIRLRAILQKHAGALAVKYDAPDCYSLVAPAGPAAIQAWRGKVRRPVIPVAWVQIGKAYVSYHLMGAYGCKTIPPALKARMQGKTCFNFKTSDEPLFQELEQLTAQAIAGMAKAGFISAK